MELSSALVFKKSFLRVKLTKDLSCLIPASFSLLCMEIVTFLIKINQVKASPLNRVNNLIIKLILSLPLKIYPQTSIRRKKPPFYEVELIVVLKEQGYAAVIPVWSPHGLSHIHELGHGVLISSPVFAVML